MACQFALSDRLDDHFAPQPVDVVEDDGRRVERGDSFDGGVQSGPVQLGAGVGIVEDADDGVVVFGAVAPARLFLRGSE